MILTAKQKAQAYDSCNIMEMQGSFAYNLSRAFTKADSTNAYKLFHAFPELFTQAKEAYADEMCSDYPPIVDDREAFAKCY